MLTPIGKKIIVKPIDVKQGTLFLTNQKPTLFQVLAMGDEVTKVKTGSTIYLQNFHGVDIEHEKEKFIIIEESSILAKLD